MRNVPALVKVELLKYARQPIVIGFGVAFPLAWVAINGMMSFGPPPARLKPCSAGIRPWTSCSRRIYS